MEKREIPVKELEKLEAARVELFKLLDEEGFWSEDKFKESVQLTKILDITRPMYQIANRKNWEK